MPSAVSVASVSGAAQAYRFVAELKHVFEIQALVAFRYFWRDKIGNEVDLLIERGGILTPVEFKSGATF